MPVATMPKKPAGAPETAPPKARASLLNIKASPEWRDWLARGAEYCRTDASKLIDAALIDYLKGKGFSEAPPKR